MREKQLQLNKKYRAEVVNLWVEVGNRISMIYCGTESVAAHLTKEEESSFFSFLTGGFRSFNRYLNASLNDSDKQESIDYFLGSREELCAQPTSTTTLPKFSTSPATAPTKR